MNSTLIKYNLVSTILKKVKFISILLISILYLFTLTGCMENKAELALKKARQQDREKAGNSKWWLMNEEYIPDKSPLINFYKNNPDIASSLKWSFFISKECKNLSSVQSLFVYHYICLQSYLHVEQLKKQVLEQPDNHVPDTYNFLFSAARLYYKLEDLQVPSEWTYSALCKAFISAGELYNIIIDYYKNAIIKSDGTLSSFYFTREATSEYEMKITIRYTKGKEDIPDESFIPALSDVFADHYSIPLHTQIEMKVENNSLSLYFKKIIPGKQIFLSFHIVDDQATSELSKRIKESGPGAAFIDDFKKTIPEYLMLKMVITNFDTSFYRDYGYTLLHKKAIINNTHIASAEYHKDPRNLKPIVTLTLTPEGGELFYKATTENIDESCAILYNDIVIFMARIIEPIRDRVQISGSLNVSEAQELVEYLSTK